MGTAADSRQQVLNRECTRIIDANPRSRSLAFIRGLKSLLVFGEANQTQLSEMDFIYLIQQAACGDHPDTNRFSPLEFGGIQV